jgi:hypothetical protein
MRWLPVVLLLTAASCTREPSKRTQDQLAALQKKKEAAARAAREGADALAPLNTDVVRLEAPYDDVPALVVTADGPCPEGLWALFPGPAPGLDAEEKRANEARRAELAAALAARTVVVKLHAPDAVKLAPFDAPRGRFVIEVAGTVDCQDASGRIALAWTEAKAVAPRRDDADVVQRVWQAPPVRFELPMGSLSEAKAFYEANRFTLSARVAFKAGRVEQDKKLVRMGKVSQKALGETIEFGGGAEDWGAGRLLRATLLGVRVATDKERKQLFDQRR